MPLEIYQVQSAFVKICHWKFTVETPSFNSLSEYEQQS